ncbi:MAG: hypothetical protein ACF8Q5_04235 [Phycisphaerales bacterium JB040]
MSQFPPPAQNWNSGHAPRRESGSIVVPMILGAVLFAVGCGSGLVAGWFAGVSTSFADAFDLDYGPADTGVSVEAPGSVTAGEPFTITLTLTETSGEGRTIDTIDVVNADEVGIAFVSGDPAPTYVDTGYGFLEMTHDAPLGPNASASFEVTLTCDTPGTHTVELAVYFSETFEATRSFELTVLPAGDGPGS